MKTLWLLLPLLLLGCASGPRPQTLAPPDIIALVKAGASDDEIIRDIDQSGSVFHLDQSEVAQLHAAGVSDRVIAYMLDTRAAAAKKRWDDADDAEWHARYGYWYCPYCQ